MAGAVRQERAVRTLPRLVARMWITVAGSNAGCALAVDRGLVACAMGGAAPQGVFGAIKVLGTSSQGLVGPLQLLMGALLDRGHIFFQDRGTFVEQPFSRVQSGFALIGVAFPLVGQSFSTIGQVFAAVSRQVPIIGERFAAVGRTVPIIGKVGAVVSRALAFLQWRRLFQ